MLMKTTMKRLVVCGCLMAGLEIGAVVRAEEEDAQQPAIDLEAMAQMIEQFRKPGEQHEQMAKMVGDYKTLSKIYYPDPTDPSVSEGEATFKMIMGGRYLQQKFHSTFDGEKYEGLGTSAYDKAQKKYVSTWIDNFGTGIMVMSGEVDEGTGVITETGAMSSPVGEMKMKMVTKPIDDNQFVFTMYMILPNDQEMKHMEITYTRVK